MLFPLHDAPIQQHLLYDSPLDVFTYHILAVPLALCSFAVSIGTVGTVRTIKSTFSFFCDSVRFVIMIAPDITLCNTNRRYLSLFIDPKFGESAGILPTRPIPAPDPHSPCICIASFHSFCIKNISADLTKNQQSHLDYTEF